MKGKSAQILETRSGRAIYYYDKPINNKIPVYMCDDNNELLKENDKPIKKLVDPSGVKVVGFIN